MKDNLMLIGEIAEFFGVSRKAIRLYEKKGILKPVEVDACNGYRYYSPDQVRQLNALLELKALGFSLDEIKTFIDGEATGEQLFASLEKKRQAWQQTIDAASYKMECLGGIIDNLRSLQGAENLAQMTDEERAWLLVKLVCIEDVWAQRALSEALWL